MKKPCCDSAQCIEKGPWDKQEDDKLINYISANGEASWHSLPLAAGLDQRCQESCRLRWMEVLRLGCPKVHKDHNFGEDEEDLIVRLHFLLGNRWSLIAGRLPGRTENEVKNHWNSHLREKLIKSGVIDSNNRHLNRNYSSHLSKAGKAESSSGTTSSRKS